MAEYLIKDSTLIEIANAIRNKADKTDMIMVSNFASEINALKAGGNPPNLDKTLPADASIIASKSVTCNVLILGDYLPEDYTFQWYVNNTAVVGATKSSYTFKPSGIGTSTIYCNVTNQAGTSSSRVATITSRSTIPRFKYTGSYQVVNDANAPISSSTGNWKIRFLTSGTLTFTELNGAADGIDLFLVGGGGGGARPDKGYGGGGGGYTRTVRGIRPTLNAQYTITVGAGGTAPAAYAGVGGAGGSSSAFNNTIGGGKGANSYNGANGGSGGGAGSWYQQAGNGGSNGGNGAGFASTNGGAGGTGQGSTTREFGESSGNLYAGGGGGHGHYNHHDGGPANGAGGAGGGGNGGEVGANGAANTGGGGGGSHEYNNGVGGAGGSGIVIIRNKR